MSARCLRLSGFPALRKRGEFVVGRLRQHDLQLDFVNAAVESARAVFNPRELRANRPYRLVRSLDGVLRERQSFDEVMGEFQAVRDAHALPVYEFTTQMATLAPPPPEEAQLLGAVARDQDAMDLFAGVIAGTVSAAEFFSPQNIGRIMAGAA